MELLQSIYIILLTLRPPFAILLSTTENVRGPTGSTTVASPGKFLHLQGFVSLIAKSTFSSEVSLVSSLPPLLKQQAEYDGEKYSTAEGQGFAYTRNKNLRSTISTPNYCQGGKNFNTARNDRHRKTFTRTHNAPKLARLFLGKHTLNAPSTLIRSLAKLSNILSSPNSSHTRTLSSHPSNDSSDSFQLGSHQLHPKPDILKQQVHLKQRGMPDNTRITSNITQNARHKSKRNTSSVNNIFSRHKRDIIHRIRKPKNKRFQANRDKTRTDFVGVFSEGAGNDMTLRSATPRSTLNPDLQIPTGSDPPEKLARFNSGFIKKYSEMLTWRDKTHAFLSHAVKRPETAQTEEEDKTASSKKGSVNSSRSLTSPVAVSQKWCQEHFTFFKQRLIRLDCVGEQFEDAPPDVKYFLPDVDKINLTRVNFQRLLEVVQQARPARVPNLYLVDSTVPDVADVFRLVDRRFIITLKLFNNSIEKLDSSTFSQTDHLDVLSLRNNLLTQLRGFVFHSNGRLGQLYLDNNEIATIDKQALAGLSHLMSLSLSHNNLGRGLNLQPGLFGGCSKLQILDVSWNQLTHIAPGTFSELSNLIQLVLENNQLKVVSPTWNLPSSLKNLLLANNEITHLEDGVFDHMDLNLLYLESNKLQTLSPKLQMYLSTRIKVSLAHNSWRCDCNLVYLIHHVTSRAHDLYKDVVCSSPQPVLMSSIVVPNITCPVDNTCAQPVCTPCTRGLQRQVGTRCACMEGTQPSDERNSRSGCSPCPDLHYKPAPGNGRCVPCSLGSVPASGPAPVCACAKGYFTNSQGDCEKCPAGTYKTYAGVGSCSPCSAGSQHLQQCSPLQPEPRQNGNLTRTSDDKHVTVWPSVAAAVGVLVLFMVIVLIFLARYYHSKQTRIMRYISKTNIGSGSLHILDTDTQNSHGSNSNSVEFRCNGRHCILIKSVGTMIGRGAFGQVYEGYAYLSSHDKEPSKIALKRLKDSATDEEVKSMKEELDQMLNVGPHPNIIGLYGSVFYDGQLCIVMEYADLGDLLTYLKTQCAFPLQYVSVGSNGLVVEQSAPKVEDNRNHMMFAWQIAKGMSHLESHRFIHRDLATRNCLLTRGPIAKVSDFGLSKDAYELGHYKRVQKDRVPFKWLSPEALLWGQYSSKSDVWAFGILLWELYTFGGTPYPQVTTEQLRELHENGYRMSKPPACPEQLYRIMRACWREDPRQRPSFKQLVQTLDNLIQKINDREYLELHAHGLKSSNPLPFTKEDMEDQKTSLEFVYRNKRLGSYQTRHTYCDPPYGNMTIAINVLNKPDNLLFNDTFPMLTDFTENTGDATSTGSTATSGFQSMSSGQTM